MCCVHVTVFDQAYDVAGRSSQLHPVPGDVCFLLHTEKWSVCAFVHVCVTWCRKAAAPVILSNENRPTEKYQLTQTKNKHTLMKSHTLSLFVLSGCSAFHLRLTVTRWEEFLLCVICRLTRRWSILFGLSQPRLSYQKQQRIKYKGYCVSTCWCH